MKRYVTLIILALFVQLLLSQNKVDSLLRQLPKLSEDSTKIQVYLDLFRATYRSDMTDALQYATEAEILSEKLGQLSELAEAKRLKSIALTGLSKYEESERELLKSIELFTQLGNKAKIVDLKIEYGNLMKLQSRPDESIVLLLEALSMADSLGDKNNIARIHNYLGLIFQAQDQYEKAVENFQEALTLVKELGIKPGISACLTNLASSYTYLGQYDNAIKYNEEALEIKRQIGDKLGEARVLINLGGVYNHLDDYDTAEKIFKQAQNVALQVDSPILSSKIEYNLMVIAYGRKEYAKSIGIGEKLSANPNFLNLDMLVKVYRRMSLSYGELGDYHNAHKMALEWYKYSDSLYERDMLELSNDLEAKYQNEQKVKEINLLESRQVIQSLQLNKRLIERNAIIVFTLVMLILAGLLFNQYRIKQKANKRLKELDQLKSNFFANISHEFRTPLTLIKGPIEQLEQNFDEKLSMENVKMIRRSANRVLNMVNQLLDLSKMDQGNLKLSPTEGDVYRCLRAACSSFNSHAAQRGIDYKVLIPQETLWTSFDRDKTDNIVYNLLSNAFKFSNKGSSITFIASYHKGFLQILVSDSGMGIPEEKLPYIFDRFYQVDDSDTREQEGSGIGLSLTKDLVELMDGTITVESAINIGTEFRIQIPLEEIKTGKSTMDEAEPKPQKTEQKVHQNHLEKEDNRNVPSILMVEDNADMRHYIKEQLTPFFKVMEAMNGDTGFKKAASLQPELIITDLMMPRMDGIELCRKLKTDVNTSHIPVIMLTAKAGIDNKIEGLETGADDYLTKPFEAKELLVRTKNLIEQRKNLRELYSRSEVNINPRQVTVNSVDEKFLQNLIQVLETNHADPEFGVPQIQNALAMSKTQLHRKVKALTNEAPGELLRNFRLKRAALLLSQNADTVTQIAYQVGFNNLSYFAKCFKDRYQVSPSSYN